MDEDQWTYYSTMSEEVDMDFQDEQDCGVNEGHVDCLDAFNTSQVFAIREDVLQWARTVAQENGFVAVIMRSDTYTGSRGRTLFVLIECERSGKYKCRKKEFVRRDTGTRKCGCPFKIHGKLVHEGEGWTMKLICGIHNHELAKTLVGHPYARRLTYDEKNIIADMMKSNVKPRNIMLTLKEHNANSCTTIKQIYNAISAYHSSIRGDDTQMQHLMRLLERDQYIHWHRLKDQDVVRDLFWCHPDAVKLCNACHLVFLIDITYKTNRYRLPLLDFVGVTPTGMTFSAGFAYLEGLKGHSNRVTPKAYTPKSPSGSLPPDSDCPSEQEFPEHLQRFQVACFPWPMFVDYVCETWIVPHKEKFITAWTNKVMHLGNTTTNRVESAHWSLKRVLQNNVGDLCSVWDAMNNMIMLQHTEIRALFETSTHVVGHVFKKTLYKRLLGMVSRYALNEISVEFERVRHFKDNPSSCGCVLRTMLDQGLCEAEVSTKEEMDRIYKIFEALDVCGKVTFKSKLREFAFPDETSMCPPPPMVNTKGAPKKVMKRSERSTKCDPSYWEYVDAYHSVQNNNTLVRPSASSFEAPKPTRMIPMLDQFAPFMHGFIEDIVDVKTNGNCGYQSLFALLGMGEECWAVMRNELIKELGKWLQYYIKIFGGTERFEQLRLSLHVDGLSKQNNIEVVDEIHYRRPLEVTGINPQKFDIPKECTINELKDLIKQVAPKGNPPHGIHESQLVRRLFYRQPAHLEYSDNVLKFEIIELKSDDDVLKVLVESNYWK
ncbi:Protein FAR1-RELATED SEQUENCE 5 [Glycine soja]